MDLFFNDVSCVGLTDEMLTGVVEPFAAVAKEAYSQGFLHIRFDKDMRKVMLGHGVSFAQYCERHKKNKAIGVILSFSDYPYFASDKEDEFLEADAYVVEVLGQKVQVYGLAAAFIYNSPAIGFCIPGWDGLIYSIKECGGKDREGTVMCLSRLEHFNEKCYEEWADKYLPEPILIKSIQIPMDKKKHLSQHHGFDILDKFSDKILRSPYVEEVINSIDRCSSAKNFIEDLRDENIIDIRLVKEGGYGIAVRTTARNHRQLKKIAEILETRYS
jgi:hypothetical protein